MSKITYSVHWSHLKSCWLRQYSFSLIDGDWKTTTRILLKKWNAFSWFSFPVYWFKRHWISFLEVQFTMSQRWFRLQDITWTSDLVHWHIYAPVFVLRIIVPRGGIRAFHQGYDGAGFPVQQFWTQQFTLHRLWVRCRISWHGNLIRVGDHHYMW